MVMGDRIKPGTTQPVGNVKKTAKKLHDDIFSVGNSVSPEVAFKKFRGRDVDPNALMRARGFPVT